MTEIVLDASLCLLFGILLFQLWLKEQQAESEIVIQVKMGGLHAPQTTGRMAAALFRHATARFVDGYAALSFTLTPWFSTCPWIGTASTGH